MKDLNFVFKPLGDTDKTVEHTIPEKAFQRIMNRCIRKVENQILSVSDLELEKHIVIVLSQYGGSDGYINDFFKIVEKLWVSTLY